ncbi:hypothetical protein T492DRAFT_918080 [Pavlovales sp. CCMP2436]|nr:hypothetical protein T492DRAFT_918080 [Pavlovales sp. CCMP2436]
MYDDGAPTSRFGTGPERTVAMRLFDLAPGNDATARRASGTYEYARPTGAASRVLWDNSFELISSLVASGTATIYVEGAAEGKPLRSCLHKSARLDSVAAVPDVYEFKGDADPLGLDRYGLYVGQCIVGGRLAFFVYTPSAGAAIFGRWGTEDMRALKLRCHQTRTNLLRAQAGLPLVPAEASELLAFAGDRSPSTLTRALEMQALPAAQAVSHYRASRAKNPATHAKISDTCKVWHKADIKGGALKRAMDLARRQHITLEEAQSLVAQHPACPCPTCGHTAFTPSLMKVCVPALYAVT